MLDAKNAKINERILFQIRDLLSQLQEKWGSETLLYSAEFKVKEGREGIKRVIFLDYEVTYTDKMTVSLGIEDPDLVTTASGRISIE